MKNLFEMERNSVIKLGDVLTRCREEDLNTVRKNVYRVFFSSDGDERRRLIDSLSWTFGYRLRGGYYENGRLFLNVSTDGVTRIVDLGDVPKEYNDIGQRDFRV